MPDTKTDEYLASLFTESFKREIDGDEAIWRSLPFFAALLGLAVTVLPSVFRAALALPAQEWRVGALTIFASALIAFAWAGYWLARVIRPRSYQYPPNDQELLDYAESLRAFHRGEGLASAEADEETRDDLRAFVLVQLAEASTLNRQNNNERAAARTQVLLFAVTGFLLAFLSEATILVAQAFEPHATGGAQHGPQAEAGASAGATRRTPARPAAFAHRAPGSELLQADRPGDRGASREGSSLNGSGLGSSSDPARKRR